MAICALSLRRVYQQVPTKTKQYEQQQQKQNKDQYHISAGHCDLTKSTLNLSNVKISLRMICVSCRPVLTSLK